MEATTHVQFVCQQCKQPLKIDLPLMDLNVEAFQKLTEPLRKPASKGQASDTTVTTTKTTTSNIGSGARRVTRRVTDDIIELPIVRPSLLSEDAETTDDSRQDVTSVYQDSFVVVRVSTDRAKRQLSLNHRLKVSSKLFDIISGEAHVDHPLCEELQRDLANEIKEAEVEREHYRYFLQTEALINVDEAEQQRLEAEIAQLQQEEQKLLQELAKIDKDREMLSNQGRLLEMEATELQQREQNYWRELNSFQSAQEQFQNERDTVKLKYTNAVEQFKRLSNSNVYSDVFHIFYDSQNFGTINGLRLGRISNYPDWSEINAAWGHSVLLLQTLARKADFRFQNYKLIPMGSFSKIEKIGDSKTIYELYGSGEFSRFLRIGGRFDSAMVAFLDCMNQLFLHLQSKNRNITIPFRIQNDKIGEFSVKLSFNQDVSWSRALKYTLTNLKWLQATICAQAPTV